MLRNGISRFSEKASGRTVHTKRYAKETPGHQVRINVKYVSLNDSNCYNILCFQYTATDDATGIRALKIYKKHNHKNAFEFKDHIIDKFTFLILNIRTDRDHKYKYNFIGMLKIKG